LNHIVNILWIKNYLMYDSKFNTVFLILTIITGLISLSDQLTETKMDVFGEKEDNKKSNDLNFKVYTDYLIQDPSEYGEKDN
jgi:membrane-bound metal-dependent hydrolase YbcI (DUF457 family)